jgi:hypothetical protein
MAADPYAIVNTTNYKHPRDPNLNCVHHTLEYDTNGKPVMRVSIGSDININGDVNIPGTVSLSESTLAALESTNTTVSGTVNLSDTTLSALENINANVSGTVTANQGTTPWLTTQTPVPESTDAFGRLRVSDPFTIADYHHVSGENPEMILKTNGSGSGTANVNTSAYTLSVGTGNGDYAIHQSKMYHHYLPGKSQLVNASFLFGTHRNNTVKRTGYFDDLNGVFFEQDGSGTLYWVERKTLNGTTTENRISQLNWNKDTCNTSLTNPTTGKTGSWTLDITKTQLIYLDFQWLGVGRIRVGFVHNGNWIIAHEFYHSNTLATVYWKQPSLPIRCEIRNTGVAVGTASMDQICSTVMSEGGYAETGLVFQQKSSLLGRTIQNGGNSICLIAIRLKNTFNTDLVRGIVRAQQASMLITNAPVYFELYRFDSHTSITGGTWISQSDDSIVEYNTTATGFSGGLAISGQFLEAAASKGTTTAGAIINPTSNKRGFISQNYDSTDSACYAIIVTALGNQNNLAISAFAALQWSETR